MYKVVKKQIASYTVFMNNTKVIGERKQIIIEEQQKSKLAKRVNLLV